MSDEMLLHYEGVEVSLEDEYLLEKYPWFIDADGYPRNGSIERRLHQAIMGKKEGYDIDHIDGNKLNNRRDNLRFATRCVNNLNRYAPNKNNTSSYKGVRLHKPWGKYEAYITLNYKQLSLGYYDTGEEANLAREAFEEEVMNCVR